MSDGIIKLSLCPPSSALKFSFVAPSLCRFGLGVLQAPAVGDVTVSAFLLRLSLVDMLSERKKEFQTDAQRLHLFVGSPVCKLNIKELTQCEILGKTGSKNE